MTTFTTVKTVKIGQRVKDRLTGFEGTVTGRCEYLTGCCQVLVQPGIKTGNEWIESRWFDEPRLEIVDAGSIAAAFATNPTPEKGANVEAPRK